MKKQTRKGFMDYTDFLHEIGEAKGGSKVYPSIKDLKANEICWKQCGIVEVKITLERVVAKENFKNSGAK